MSIDFTSIKNFVQNNQVVSKGKQDKPVLKLQNGVLSVVLLKNTTLFERTKAWFGYGPLSLANIAEFISTNAHEIKWNTTLSGQEKKDFFTKLHDCTLSYNDRHTRKIDKVAMNNLFKVDLNTVHSLDASKAFFHTDATYKTDGAGIDDVAYADSTRGFGYVADGTGHNNSMMATVLNRVFANFNETYQSAYDSAALDSPEKSKNFVKDQLTFLGNAIHNEEEAVQNDPKKPGMTHMNDGTLKPAFAFAQIVKIGDKSSLISVNYSDTMLLIKKADGSFDTSLAKPKTDYGLGERHRNVEKMITETALQPGDVVYGFSDGIGEFLTMQECQQIISKNSDPAMLLSELKAKIIENGKSFVQDPNDRERQKPTVSANSHKTTKFHDPEDRHFHDDISMFSLSVSGTPNPNYLEIPKDLQKNALQALFKEIQVKEEVNSKEPLDVINQYLASLEKKETAAGTDKGGHTVFREFVTLPFEMQTNIAILLAAKALESKQGIEPAKTVVRNQFFAKPGNTGAEYFNPAFKLISSKDVNFILSEAYKLLNNQRSL